MDEQYEVSRSMMATGTPAYTLGFKSEFDAPNPYDRTAVEYWQFVRGYAKRWIKEPLA